MSGEKFIFFSILILIVFLIFTSSTNFLKTILKFIINLFVGICFILISNFFLDKIGLFIGINEFTSVFVGLLGIPGLICLYILKIML